MRDQRDLRTSYFGPRAGVAISQLYEIYGPIELRAPLRRLHSAGRTVDLNEGSRTQQRIHRVIVHADVTVLAMADIQLLNQCDGDFTPYLHHAGNQAG